MNKQLTAIGTKMEFDIRVLSDNLTQRSGVERRAEGQGQSLVALQTAGHALLRGLTQL